MFDADKTRVIGLPYGEKNYDDTLSRFHLVPERNGQTDRRTDERTQICYINIARQYADARFILTRDKIEIFP